MVPNPMNKWDDLEGKNHPYFWFNTPIISRGIPKMGPVILKNPKVEQPIHTMTPKFLLETPK